MIEEDKKNNHETNNNGTDIFADLKKEKENTDSNSKSKIENETSTSTNVDTNSEIVINTESKKERIQRSFYITPKLDRELEKLKKRTGKDKSELVRMAISYMVENAKVE